MLSPPITIEPSLLRFIRKACWSSTLVTSFDARIRGRATSFMVWPSSSRIAAAPEWTSAVEREWNCRVPNWRSTTSSPARTSALFRTTSVSASMSSPGEISTICAAIRSRGRVPRIHVEM